MRAHSTENRRRLMQLTKKIILTRREGVQISLEIAYKQSASAGLDAME